MTSAVVRIGCRFHPGKQLTVHNRIIGHTHGSISQMTKVLSFIAPTVHTESLDIPMAFKAGRSRGQCQRLRSYAVAKFADVLGAEPDISLCNSMAREVVSLPLPRHPIVGTQIISIEQSWYRGNLYEISQECPSHSNGLRLGSLPNSIPNSVQFGTIP